MNEEVKSTYERVQGLIERRMGEAWRYEEAVSLLKESLRLAQVALIKRVMKEHQQVERDREQLERMRKRLSGVFEELERDHEDWNERSFFATSETIEAELGTRKHFPLLMDAQAFEDALWRLMESSFKTPAAARFQIAFPQDERHRRSHDAFLRGEIALQQGEVPVAVNLWQDSLDSMHELTSPATLRELGVMHRLPGAKWEARPDEGLRLY